MNDLYESLSRLPEPTQEQVKCSHEKRELVDRGYEDWDGEWHQRMEEETYSLFVDIEGTHLKKCIACGYTQIQ